MPLTYETVIVPVDFSGESAEAIHTALEAAGDPSRLHLVHVLVSLDDLSPVVTLGDVSDESRRTQVIDKLEELAEESGVSGAERAVLIGTPGLEITEYAATHKADLIVIPSHGYHGMKRLVLGSVTERVIRHAECNVLVLRRSDAE